MVAIGLVAGVVIAGAVAIYEFVFPGQPHRGSHPSELWETKGGSFRVRVARYEETNPTWRPGFYYVLMSMQESSEHWQEVMMVRRIHEEEIPKDHLHVKDDGKAYFYMAGKLAATTDGGGHWAIWDASTALPGGDSMFITSAAIEDNGIGVLSLAYRSAATPEAPRARTEDYGIHWAIDW